MKQFLQDYVKKKIRKSFRGKNNNGRYNNLDVNVGETIIDQCYSHIIFHIKFDHIAIKKSLL